MGVTPAYGHGKVFVGGGFGRKGLDRLLSALPGLVRATEHHVPKGVVGVIAPDSIRPVSSRPR